MPAPVRDIPVPELLWRLQTTLGMSQKRLGALMGKSSRTIIRYYQGGGILLPETYAKLAVACQPHDPALAQYLAARGGTTVERLLGPGASGSAQTSAAPSARHIADSVVCAAAETMQVSPHVMRPALVAALERMFALGIGAPDLLRAMQDAGAPSTGTSARTAKR